jgi:hypothetical protein
MGTTVVKRNASNIDLQRAIEAAIPTAVAQMKQRSNEFKGKSEAETCKKIFDYLKNQITYKADGSEQQVRVPSGLIRTRQGDCKSYSVFTSAILTNLGIPHKLVYASYDPNDSTPTHIYVTTNKGCIIDAVYGKFNAEKKPTFKKLKNMNISYIAGVRPRTIGASVDTKQFPFHLYITKDGKPHHIDSYRTRSAADKVRKMFREDAKPRVSSKYIGSMGKYGTGGACGIGAVNSGLDWAKQFGVVPNKSEVALALESPAYRKYAAQKILLPAILGRGIVRKLIEKNAGGFANSLSKVYEIARADNNSNEFKKYRAIEIDWFEKGGNPNELLESIKEGNTKTPTGAYFNKLMGMKAGGYNPNVAQWIAAAISVLFGKKYNESTGQITGNDLPIGGEPVTDTAAVVSSAPWWAVTVSGIITTLGLAFINKGSNPAPGEGTIPDGTNTSTDQGSTSSMLLPIILVGGAAAAYFIFAKKK